MTMLLVVVEPEKCCEVDLTSNHTGQVCSQETEGHGVPWFWLGVWEVWAERGKEHERRKQEQQARPEAAVKTEWLILTVQNVCDRSKAHQRLENKQKQNLRNYPFPGYRAKFRFFQELIPLTSMRGENTCSQWNVWFPLLNYSFMHSNIWPMSPWPHQEHGCTGSVIAGLSCGVGRTSRFGIENFCSLTSPFCSLCGTYRRASFPSAHSTPVKLSLM